MLDLDSVRLFLLAAEFGNLTRAAEAAGTVQPVVSARLKALEAQVGRRLLDRSPRFVRLTEDGAAFLERARTLIAAHDAALHFGSPDETRIVLAISDHALGIGIEAVLRQVRAALPTGTLIEVRSGLSHAMRALFESGEAQAAILRREGGGHEGEVLGLDPLGWRAGDDAPAIGPDAIFPLATLGPPCGVREAAIRALERQGRRWREAFMAGSCVALLAGARAGFGIAPMGRVASGGAADRGPELGLPAMPPSEIVLLGRSTSPAVAIALRALSAGVRSALV